MDGCITGLEGDDPVPLDQEATVAALTKPRRGVVMPQIVILKADDFGWHYQRGFAIALKNLAKRVLSHPISEQHARVRWIRFIELIETKKAKAGLGLVCNFLEKADKSFMECARLVAQSENFEIWHHGFDHMRRGQTTSGENICEFKHTPLTFQLEHLQQGLRLAECKLGIKLHTFGAPENAIDENTKNALQLVPEIRVWLYGLPGTDKVNLTRNGEIEYPLFKPDFGKFVENFDTTITPLTLQVHPAAWEDEQFVQFENILDFLKAQGVQFMTPWEYCFSVSGHSLQ